MKIFIATFGSRGDVQPYLALGQGLLAAGHAVTLCTAEQFEPFVRESGLAYGHMTGELLKLLDTDAGRSAMEETVGLAGSIGTMAKLARQTRPLTRQTILDSWTAAQTVRPEVVIYHPKALGAVSIAEAFQAQPIMAILQPMYMPTADFPTVGMPRLRLGGWYNRLTYKAVAAGMATYGGMVNTIRQEEMGLDKFPRGTGLYRTSAGAPIPVLHAFSRHVVPRPSDWPDHAFLPGYWFLEQPQDYEPPPELLAFLEDGQPPVYIGFGSMAGKDPARLTGIILEGVRQAGVRAILASGWGGLDAAVLPAGMLQIDAAPHDWLFPRMAAVVHHGGAGTTGAGLRAGRPSLICPFMGDQPFWGQRVFDLGAGPEPIPQKQLTAATLAAALRQLQTDVSLQRTAAQLGELIRAEDGVAAAVSLIEGPLAP